MRYIGQNCPQDNALAHAAGETLFIDDIKVPEDTLHMIVIGAAEAAGRVRKIDIDPVRDQSQVELVLCARDIPGENSSGLAGSNVPVFVEREIQFAGQPVFAVIAKSAHQAHCAAARARVEIDAGKQDRSMDQDGVPNAGQQSLQVVKRGRSGPAIRNARFQLQGRIRITAGRHSMATTGQACLAVPGEEGAILVFCSTHRPHEVRTRIARALDIPADRVIVKVPRMAGLYDCAHGQTVLRAIITALGAIRTNRPVLLGKQEQTDFCGTEKPAQIIADYRAGFNQEGVIGGVEFTLENFPGEGICPCGPVNDCSPLHIDNSYYLKNITVNCTSYAAGGAPQDMKSGSGAVQAVLAIERVMDEIASHLEIDPLIVRMRNLYGTDSKNMTHYGMKVTESVLPGLIETLKRSATYLKRRRAVIEHNRNSPVIKRGIALVPVKIGIGCAAQAQEQAGVRLQVAGDGRASIQLGASEAGQGLFTKLAQITAETFQIDPSNITCECVAYTEIPGETQAYSETQVDLYGAAVKIAAEQIRGRLARFTAERYNIAVTAVRFAPDVVRIGKKSVRFKTLAGQAESAGISLVAEGFQAPPVYRFNRQNFKGRPFHYFTHGAAVSEVEVDTLTGESRVLRVDMVQDCGCSLNPAIDTGRIEGGFLQGMGWLTSGELHAGDENQIQTSQEGGSTIPGLYDAPEKLNVRLWKKGENPEQTVYHSKSAGEAPAALAVSVYSALVHAVAAAVPGHALPRLDVPVTPRRVLMAIHGQAKND